MEQIIVERHGKVGEIVLHRPEALHALNEPMLRAIERQLKEWESSSLVCIVLRSSTSRSFCAGGDIKGLYAARESEEAKQRAMDFFKLEYRVDAMIDRYSIPIVALLDGITMGGGVGLAYGASYKVVTDATKWAMPEMKIGFYPDVGAGAFLHDAPGFIGYYLGLTGETIGGADAYHCRYATHHIQQADVAALREQLLTIQSSDEIEPILRSYHQEVPSSLLTYVHEMNEWFAPTTMEEKKEKLRQSTNPLAQSILQQWEHYSPLSLKVTNEWLHRGRSLTFEEALQVDLRLVEHFLYEADFYEGIRSVVIDKDRTPRYRWTQLEEVTDAYVHRFFERRT